MAKIAFMFPGQGAQYVGMGKDLAETYPEAMAIFDRANAVLDFDLKQVLWHGTEEQLKLTEVTQPAILATSVACMEVLKANGIQPDMVAGLSLGEYAALVAADVLTLEEAIPLVQKRGQYMQEAVPAGKGTMAAIIGLDEPTVRALCGECSSIGVVELANFNCPGQIVVAGEVAAVEAVAKMATENGARKAIILPVSAPFHCSMLKPAGEKLAEALNEISVNNAVTTVVSSVNAQEVVDAAEIKQLLIDQVSSCVLWSDTVQTMLKLGVDLFIEVGPGKSLKGFMRRIDKRANCFNVQDVASLDATLEKVQGAVDSVAG